jgi:hypothetical protein
MYINIYTIYIQGFCPLLGLSANGKQTQGEKIMKIYLIVDKCHSQEEK